MENDALVVFELSDESLELLPKATRRNIAAAFDVPALRQDNRSALLVRKVETSASWYDRQLKPGVRTHNKIRVLCRQNKRGTASL